jgi:hypothetical protein
MLQSEVALLVAVLLLSLRPLSLLLPVVIIIIITIIIVIVIVAGIGNPLSQSGAHIFGGNCRVPSFVHKRLRRMSTTKS